VAGHRQLSDCAAGIIALLCFAVMLVDARPAVTAPPTGTIEGVVKDAQGQPLQGVQLILRVATGRIAKRATSRPAGSYRFADIAADHYSISGAKAGFASAVAAVAVRAGGRAFVDLTLAPAAPDPSATPPVPATETAPPTPGPLPPGPIELEELTVVAKRLEAARVAIEPQIRASTYTMTRQAIETLPGGANTTLNQVILQAPGVSQDAESAGGIHIRNEMQPAEFRINGIPLPTGLSFFGQASARALPTQPDHRHVAGAIRPEHLGHHRHSDKDWAVRPRWLDLDIWRRLPDIASQS
jgi:hypothetical protein